MSSHLVLFIHRSHCLTDMGKYFPHFTETWKWNDLPKVTKEVSRRASNRIQGSLFLVQCPNWHNKYCTMSLNRFYLWSGKLFTHLTLPVTHSIWRLITHTDLSTTQSFSKGILKMAIFPNVSLQQGFGVFFTFKSSAVVLKWLNSLIAVIHN